MSGGSPRRAYAWTLAYCLTRAFREGEKSFCHAVLKAKWKKIATRQTLLIDMLNWDHSLRRD